MQIHNLIIYLDAPQESSQTEPLQIEEDLGEDSETIDDSDIDKDWKPGRLILFKFYHIRYP